MPRRSVPWALPPSLKTEPENESGTGASPSPSEGEWPLNGYIRNLRREWCYVNRDCEGKSDPTIQFPARHLERRREISSKKPDPFEEALWGARGNPH